MGADNEAYRISLPHNWPAPQAMLPHDGATIGSISNADEQEDSGRFSEKRQ
jgi:hypothetical protein